MRWKIFYDDGQTFSDADGSVGEAKKTGVQAVVMECKEHGRVRELVAAFA